MLKSVEETVRREIGLMQARMRDTSVGAGERNARTLASLVRTLRAVQEVRAKVPPAAETEDARPPRDLAALRDALAARLEQIRAEHTERGAADGDRA